MPRPSISADSSELLTSVLSLVMILVVVAVLYVAHEVFIPLALALLFSFLLAPVVTRLERWRFPRIPAVLTTVALAFAVVAGVGYLVVDQVIDLTKDLPSYKENISHRIASIHKGATAENPFSKAAETVKELGAQFSETTPPPNSTRPSGPTSANKGKVAQVEIVEPATSLPKVLQSVFGPVLGPLGTAAIVVVFVMFMLIKREDLRDRIIHLIGRGRLNVTTQALDEAAQKVSGYLFMQVIINVCFGIPVGIGLYFIGVPNAFLWGLLATLLRFVPYIGAWIALGFPLVLSLAVTDRWSMPMETLALFAVVEIITSNVLEPWLYGAHTGLSPVAIMVATIFWTWMWGGVGLLLATPLTVCVAVLGKYIPSLSFLDALLGDEPTLSPQDRFYQRLLALDRREAEAVAAEYLQEHTLGELYSEVFVPALAQAEREEQNEKLSERRQRFIFETSREMVEEYGAKPPPQPTPKKGEENAGDMVVVALEGVNKSDPPKEAPAKNGETAKPLGRAPLSNQIVYCLPAADEADEIAAAMLAQLLEQAGCRAESVSYKTLANEMVAMVAEAGSRVVCISATPPHNTLHTRYLCKLLRAKFPTLHIVVGLWDAEQGEEQLARRKDRLTADRVVTTLTAALDEIKPFAVLDALPTEEKGRAVSVGV
jgi:predicted PurR-regulated permease PerM